MQTLLSTLGLAALLMMALAGAVLLAGEGLNQWAVRTGRHFHRSGKNWTISLGVPTRN